MLESISPDFSNLDSEDVFDYEKCQTTTHWAVEADRMIWANVEGILLAEC